jgi:cell division transport system permease protein
MMRPRKSAGAIEAALDESGVAAGREYVSKAQALTRFRSEFADLASLTDDLDDNPFPASLEVRVRPEAEQSGQADALVKRIAGMPGVADVRYDREWLARVSSGFNAVRGAAFALALLMAVAAAVTVAAVVRLGLHARRDEIEIMKLVGSPIGFIRRSFYRGRCPAGWLRRGYRGGLALGWLHWCAGVVGSRAGGRSGWRLAAVRAAVLDRIARRRRHGGGGRGRICRVQATPG